MTGIGFPVAPVMVAWSAGAGVGLWRISTIEPAFDPVEEEMLDEEAIAMEATSKSARQAPVTARAASPSHTRRPVGKQGSAAKRRRRR